MAVQYAIQGTAMAFSLLQGAKAKRQAKEAALQRSSETFDEFVPGADPDVNSWYGWCALEPVGVNIDVGSKVPARADGLGELSWGGAGELLRGAAYNGASNEFLLRVYAVGIDDMEAVDAFFVGANAATDEHRDRFAEGSVFGLAEGWLYGPGAAPTVAVDFCAAAGSGSGRVTASHRGWAATKFVLITQAPTALGGAHRKIRSDDAIRLHARGIKTSALAAGPPVALAAERRTTNDLAANLIHHACRNPNGLGVPLAQIDLTSLASAAAVWNLAPADWWDLVRPRRFGESSAPTETFGSEAVHAGYATSSDNGIRPLSSASAMPARFAAFNGKVASRDPALDQLNAFRACLPGGDVWIDPVDQTLRAAAVDWRAGPVLIDLGEAIEGSVVVTEPTDPPEAVAATYQDANGDFAPETVQWPVPGSALETSVRAGLRRAPKVDEITLPNVVTALQATTLAQHRFAMARRPRIASRYGPQAGLAVPWRHKFAAPDGIGGSAEYVITSMQHEPTNETWTVGGVEWHPGDYAPAYSSRLPGGDGAARPAATPAGAWLRVRGKGRIHAGAASYACAVILPDGAAFTSAVWRASVDPAAAGAATPIAATTAAVQAAVAWNDVLGKHVLAVEADVRWTSPLNVTAGVRVPVASRLCTQIAVEVVAAGTAASTTDDAPTIYVCQGA